MRADLPEVVSTWRTGPEFLKHVGDGGATRSFLHPVVQASDLPAHASVGAILSMRLRFEDRETEFHVHARVLERRDREAPLGLRLAFLPEERDRQELVLASAEGESVPYLRRKSVRTPCNFDATVTLEDGRVVESKITTISERGAHVSLDTLTPEQRIVLAIAFPRERVEVMGRVTGSLAGPQRGAGIEFLFASSRQRDTVGAAVAAYRATL